MDDGGASQGSSPSGQDRLARVEQQLAELQAEVAQLARMLNRSGGGPASGHDDDKPEGGAAAPGSADAVPGGAPTPARVLLTIVLPASARAGRGGLTLRGGPVTAGALPRVNPVVVVHAPPELRGWAETRPAPLRRHVESLIEGVQERLTHGAAGVIVGKVWDPATVEWHVTDFGGFDSVSGLLGSFDNWSHREVGDWMAGPGRLAGLPGGVADGAGAVIGFLVPLPIDLPLQDLSRAIQVAGVVTFALAGGHVLACASLQSLVHEKLTDLLAGELRGVISPRPAGPEPGQSTAASSRSAAGSNMKSPAASPGRRPRPPGPGPLRPSTSAEGELAVKNAENARLRTDLGEARERERRLERRVAELESQLELTQRPDRIQPHREGPGDQKPRGPGFSS